MYVKIHKSRNRTITAICDDNLLGKTIEGNGYHLTVSEHFYKGEKKNHTEITALLQHATDLNIIGEESVHLCLELHLITHDQVIMIGKIPHALVLAL